MHAQGAAAQLAVATPPAACSFAGTGVLPRDTIVIAAGGYGGRPAGFQIDQSGNDATVFDITVHADKPVALLLAAYEPSVWSIGWTAGTRIVAVFATGYHRQAVAGLPAGTPIITSAHTEQGECGYAYLGESLAWVNPKSRAVFGREAKRVYDKAPEGAILIAESTRAPTAPMRSPDTAVESFRSPDALLAGKAGLALGVHNGLLRLATDSDVQAVRKHYQKLAANNSRAGKVDIPPIAGQARGAGPAVQIPNLYLGNTYVVLKPFTLPAGLYGGHSASFIVPKGVPAPGGELGHSTVVNLNSNQEKQACTGSGCR